MIVLDSGSNILSIFLLLNLPCTLISLEVSGKLGSFETDHIRDILKPFYEVELARLLAVAMGCYPVFQDAIYENYCVYPVAVCASFI